MTDEELREKLGNTEDGWTERKQHGTLEDISETIVAFANSLPENGKAVLFIGIANDGKMTPLLNAEADKKQKDVRRIAQNRCYPSLEFNITCRALPLPEDPEKSIIAVIVSGSNNTPHFAGPAMVRVGSVSSRANETQFEKLLAKRMNVARLILAEMEANREVRVRYKDSASGQWSSNLPGKVIECNAHFATFQLAGGTKSAPFGQIEPSRVMDGQMLFTIMLEM